jgi:hemerythrin superfamily protein
MTKTLDAIQLLKKDHETVRGLLEQLCETSSRSDKKRRTLLETVGAEVRAHARIEEEIFYPAFRAAAKTAEDRQLIAEALEEHRAAGELVLPDIEKTEPVSETFLGRCKVLKEMIEHHAREEEKEMFPRAKKLFDRAELQQLGEQMAARKEELLQQLV